MDVKFLDKILVVILFLILLTAPTQYSFDIGKAHLTIADPLIWLGGLLFFISVLAEILFAKAAGLSLGQRLLTTLKDLLPLPENIVFIVLVAISFFKAESRFEVAKELVQIIEYVAVAFVLFAKVKLNEGLLKKFGMLFLILVSAVVSLALWQYLDKSLPVMAVKSSFGNRNTYGGFLAIALPLVLAITLQIKNVGFKLWGLAILITGTVTLLSGGAALGLLFSCSLISIFNSRRAFAVWLAIIFITGGFILPKLPRDNIAVLKNSISIYDENGQAEPRYIEWQASVQMWKEDPLLGVGLGNYQSQIGMNYGFLAIKEGPKEPDHNNLFLVFASTTGLLGLIGLLGMLACWSHRGTMVLWGCKTDERLVVYRKILAMGAIGAIAGFCIASIWTALLVRGIFLMLVTIVGLALNEQKSQGNAITYPEI